MTITAMFDRVRWIKGALSANDGDNSRIKGTTTMTFLSLDSYNEQSCGAVCAVGSIMFDLGATMDNFTDGIPAYDAEGYLSTRPDGGYKHFDVFVALLRRYTVEVAQNYFRQGDEGVSYLESTNWHDTAKSRIEAKGNSWYRDDPSSIEGFNDSQYSTEQDVRNFLDVLEWLPEYRMLHGVLTGDGGALKQIYQQALRLDPDLADEKEFSGEYRLLQEIPYKIFNQIFGLSIAHAD